MFAVQLARRVLPANDGLSDHFEIKRTDGLEDFELFVLDGGGVEGGGRLDGNEGSELQHMALDHVAKRAGGFIKPATPLNTKRFRCGDLDAVNIVAVPQRLENAIAETKNQQILDSVLAEIVIDAVDLLFLEDTQNGLVEFLGCGQIAAEGLLNNDAYPGVRRRWARQAGAAELLDDVRINFRRR